MIQSLLGKERLRKSCCKDYSRHLSNKTSWIQSELDSNWAGPMEETEALSSLPLSPSLFRWHPAIRRREVGKAFGEVKVGQGSKKTNGGCVAG